MQNVLLSACFGLLLWIVQQLFGLSASIAKADEKLASVGFGLPRVGRAP